MLIPSIDIMNGDAVQLVGGQTLAINAGSPLEVAEKFSLAGEMAVIDLDAAMGQGGNKIEIEALVQRYQCRVGGGIRDESTARRWLDLGASAVIIGTAATKELLQTLPRKRLIAALDTKAGIVMSHGWKKSTGEPIADAIERLRPFVGGFLITTIEREGRMVGLYLESVNTLQKLAGDTKITIAGGVSSAFEVADLDALGIDVQAGMALYRGHFSIADSFIAMLQQRTHLDQWPTVVCDQSGRALGLTYSNAESLSEAFRTKSGVYWSRRRGLWVKGLTSGATQKLLRVDLDCDRDTLRFIVQQSGAGFCHQATANCWSNSFGSQLLEEQVDASACTKNPSSYTQRLLNDDGLLNAKLLEEASELVAADPMDRDAVLHEAADSFFFTYMKMRRSGWRFADLEGLLARRAGRVSRRQGDAKLKNTNFVESIL